MGGCLGKAEAPQPSLHEVHSVGTTVEAHSLLPESKDPNALVALLTNPTTSDKQLAVVVPSLLAALSTGSQVRSAVGTACALQRLAMLLVHAPTSTRVATAEVLRFVAANQSTHQEFDNAKVVAALIYQLHSESSRVAACCMGTLRNLSVSPSVVLKHARDELFLPALSRFLAQPFDTHSQSCAAQLLLNMAVSKDAVELLPATDVLDACIAVLAAPPPTAFAPDPEVADMCAEALVALISTSDPLLAHFRRRNGCRALLAAAARPDVLPSTLLFVAEAFNVLVGTGLARDVLAADVRPVLERMLSAQSGPDDRVVTAHVQLCGLQLADALCACEDATDEQRRALAAACAPLFSMCLASDSMALHLATAHLLLRFLDADAAREALVRADALAPALVDVLQKQSLVTSAAVVACLGRLGELDRRHADAVVKQRGLDAMLDTLENSTVAQAQRYALVSITHVLRHATPEVLSRELASGVMVDVAVLILSHTSTGKVSDQGQWVAWCCRVLCFVAAVDGACRAKVVAALAETEHVAVRAALQLPVGRWDEAAAMQALTARAAAADGSFLSKIANSRRITEAVAVGLVKGRHPYLRTDADEDKVSPHSTLENVNTQSTFDASLNLSDRFFTQAENTLVRHIGPMDPNLSITEPTEMIRSADSTDDISHRMSDNALVGGAHASGKAAASWHQPKQAEVRRLRDLQHSQFDESLRRKLTAAVTDGSRSNQATQGTLDLTDTSRAALLQGFADSEAVKDAQRAEAAAPAGAAAATSSACKGWGAGKEVGALRDSDAPANFSACGLDERLEIVSTPDAAGSAQGRLDLRLLRSSARPDDSADVAALTTSSSPKGFAGKPALVGRTASLRTSEERGISARQGQQAVPRTSEITPCDT